jgi:hypothetical protein
MTITTTDEKKNRTIYYKYNREKIKEMNVKQMKYEK